MTNTTYKNIQLHTNPEFGSNVPPICLLRAVMSSDGPAIREVPVSAIALQPLQYDVLLPPTDTLCVHACSK